MSLFVDVKKDYGNFKLNITFHHKQGVLGLLGASGSGKSLTLKLISGIITPDCGKIILGDSVLYDSEQGINLPPQKRNVGYLFQNYALFPNMTVKKNILCGLHKEQDRVLRKEKLQKVTELLQIQDLLNMHPSQLSGGQQQRTALARILVSEPEVLLLDEPFSALDFYLKDQIQMQFLEILKQFQKEVIFVSHSQEEIYHLSQRVVFFEQGQLVEIGDTKMVFKKPRSRTAAILTGCKNVVGANKIGSYEVEVPDWGICLKTSDYVENEVKAVGIHSHCFNENETENVYSIKNQSILEARYENTVFFQFENQKADKEKLWCTIGGELKKEELPKKLGVSPKDILLLYD